MFKASGVNPTAYSSPAPADAKRLAPGVQKRDASTGGGGGGGAALGPVPPRVSRKARAANGLGSSSSGVGGRDQEGAGRGGVAYREDSFGIKRNSWGYTSDWVSLYIYIYIHIYIHIRIYIFGCCCCCC